jgi:hypothetical protein
MSRFREMKRPKVSTLCAALALFIVLGGSATAASGLISGSKIKNRTISQKKLSLGTIKALKGKRGLTGAQGPAGPSSLTTFSETGSLNNQSPNVQHEIAAMNGLPGKRYLIIAKVNVFSPTGALIECGLSTNGGGGSDNGLWTSPANNSRAVIPLQLVSSASISSLSVECQSNGTNAAYTADINAMPVG